MRAPGLDSNGGFFRAKVPRTSGSAGPLAVLARPDAENPVAQTNPCVAGGYTTSHISTSHGLLCGAETDVSKVINWASTTALSSLRVY